MWQRYSGPITRDLHVKLHSRPSWHNGAWYAMSGDTVMVHAPLTGVRSFDAIRQAHGPYGTGSLNRVGQGAIERVGEGGRMLIPSPSDPHMHRGRPILSRRGLGAAGLGALPVAPTGEQALSVLQVTTQDTGPNGSLEIRERPNTSAAILGSAPHNSLVYQLHNDLDPNPSAPVDFSSSDPNANTWFKIALPDFSVIGYSSGGVNGVQFLSDTGSTNPIPGGQPITPPAPGPSPSPTPQPPLASLAAGSSNTGLIVVGVLAAAALGTGAYMYSKKKKHSRRAA